MIPQASYRLQLSPGFGFDEVAALVGYLRALGVSHVYLSPYLQAAPGSAHGYDVVDHGRINDELGGAAAHARMRAALRAHGLSQIVDVVPNHMAIVTPHNRWWWDVLENGPASRFADHFDVGWRGGDRRLRDKVLMPILGDHYGRVLESSQMRIERAACEFRVRVYDEHVLPMAPRSLSPLLQEAAGQLARRDELCFLADALHDLPRAGTQDPERVARRQRDKDVLFSLLARLLEDADVARSLDLVIERVNAEPEQLDAVLEAQNYRLAYWGVARHDLDYRRFFDVDTLAGLCVEREAVFEDTHRLPLEWVRSGEVSGLRVDHPDGLRDPARYLERLRVRAPDAYIVVEKILSDSEWLPEDWPVDGTTGYDFMAVVGGLFVDADAEATLRALYDELTGTAHPPFVELVRDKKRMVLEELLASELSRLSAQLQEICEAHPRYRDYALSELRQALRELICCLPVYRTYLREDAPPSAHDRAVVRRAVIEAREAAPGCDPRLLEFVERILVGELAGAPERELALRFQQLSGAAMAKGQEDTAFYCDLTLCSLNEVGGEPGRFGVTVERFHAHCERIQRHYPATLLASSTHDTKRSEEVRTRIALLSELPERWVASARRFRAGAERHFRHDVRDPELLYLLHQTLIGAFPIECDRLQGYMLKAAREAKRHTSWLRPNESYERALHALVSGVLEDVELMAEVRGLLDELAPAARVSSLAQLTLKLTAPGVPDLYQGNEVVRRDLTDPDNRRPIDFAALRDKLDQLDRFAALGDLEARELLARDDADLTKLFVTRKLLSLRQAYADAFGPAGDYRALSVTGERAGHVVSFARAERIVTLVPRLWLRVRGDLRDTRVALPQGRFRHALTGEVIEGGEREVAELLSSFPVAVLVNDPG